MPSGKDITGGGAGGGGKRNGGGNMTSGNTGGAKKNAYCSFCRKSYRDVGPLVEGPGDVYICGDCIELCQSILDQILAHHTGQPVEKVATDTDRDFIMSADEAKGYGIVDEILTNRELAFVGAAAGVS